MLKVKQEVDRMHKSRVVAIEKIKPVVEEIVEHKLIELLGDPDLGLELKTNVKRRLIHSLKTKAKGISAEKVARQLGLKW